MQVDFSSRYSNSIIDDGRASSKYISSFDASRRTPPRFTQEKSSTEYTSTRKLGGSSGGIGSTFERSSSKKNFLKLFLIKIIISDPPSHSPYDTLYGGNNAGRSNTYSSTTQYESSGRKSPSRGGFISSTTDSINNSNNPTYTYRVTAGDSQPRTTYPSSTHHGSGSDTVQEKSYSETHHETAHRRSSPTSGVTSSREVEHHSSGDPSIGTRLDENRFRSNISLGHRSVTPPSSSRNVEVREFSRRIGTDANNSSFVNTEPSLFTQGFNSDAFYRSAFQPQISTDAHGQKCVEMKLAVSDYEPNEIKVSVNGNDLIVQAEHNVERPPTLATRAYFYKQITLPPNTDLGTLQSQYHPDGKLHITAKLANEHASIKNN
jgi:HSP20 family molecular chaperone IbpA